jgi:hypothetical protein
VARQNRDGYFSAEDIDEQAQAAMDIVTEFYPNYEHIFIYDNATTHLKCPKNSLTARHMPTFISKEGNNWLIEVTKHDGAVKPVRTSNGFAKEKI